MLSITVASIIVLIIKCSMTTRLQNPICIYVASKMTYKRRNKKRERKREMREKVASVGAFRQINHTNPYLLHEPPSGLIGLWRWVMKENGGVYCCASLIKRRQFGWHACDIYVPIRHGEECVIKWATLPSVLPSKHSNAAWQWVS